MINLTSEQIDFLKQQKAKGVDALTAYKNLERHMNPQDEGFSSGMIGAAGETISGAAKGLGSLVKQALWDIPVGMGKTVVAGFAGDNELSMEGAEQASNIVRTAYNVGKTALTAPVEAAKGFGKWEAGVLTNKRQVAKEGAQQFLGGVGQLSGLLPTIPSQLISGATTQASKALEENVTGGEAIGKVLGGSVTQGAMMTLLDNYFRDKTPIGSEPRLTKGIIPMRGEVLPKMISSQKNPSDIGIIAKTKAKLSGIDNPDIKVISDAANVDPEFAFQVLKGGEAIKSNPKLLESRPINIVGEKMSSGFRSLENVKTSVGKEIGKIKEQYPSIKNPVDIKPAGDQFNQWLFDKFRISFKGKNKLDFKGSLLERASSGEQSFVQYIADTLNKGKSTLDDLQIKLHNIDSELYKGKKIDFGNDANIIAQQARSIINDTKNNFLKQQGIPKIESLNSAYTDLSNIVTEVERVAGSDAIKSPQILRRILTNAGPDALNIVKKMQEAAKKYGIKEWSNLYDETFFANSVEKLLGVEAERGIESAFRVGSEVAKGNVGNAIIGAGKWFSRKFVGEPASNIENIIKKVSNIKRSNINRRIAIPPISTKN